MVLRTLKNLAPTWPLFFMNSSGYICHHPLLALSTLLSPHFSHFPKCIMHFYIPMSLWELMPLLGLTCPSCPRLLPLLQIQFKCHLSSESLHPLLYLNHIFMCLNAPQNDKLLEGRSQLADSWGGKCKKFQEV